MSAHEKAPGGTWAGWPVTVREALQAAAQAAEEAVLNAPSEQPVGELERAHLAFRARVRQAESRRGAGEGMA